MTDEGRRTTFLSRSVRFNAAHRDIDRLCAGPFFIYWHAYLLAQRDELVYGSRTVRVARDEEGLTAFAPQVYGQFGGGGRLTGPL